MLEIDFLAFSETTDDAHSRLRNVVSHAELLSSKSGRFAVQHVLDAVGTIVDSGLN